jgi:hypothetical protein
MPIDIEVDANTAYVQYIMPWDLNDYHRAMQQLTDVAKASGERLHVIADFSQSPSLPAGALTHMSRTSSDTSRRGLVVVVGANGIVRTIGNVLFRINPVGTHDIYFAKTLEEAREIIARQATH